MIISPSNEALTECKDASSHLIGKKCLTEWQRWLKQRLKLSQLHMLLTCAHIIYALLLLCRGDIQGKIQFKSSANVQSLILVISTTNVWDSASIACINCNLKECMPFLRAKIDVRELKRVMLKGNDDAVKKSEKMWSVIKHVRWSVRACVKKNCT